MFEKEAEKFFKKRYQTETRPMTNHYKNGFKDGAEFGFAKANEWHKMDYNDKKSYKNIPRYVELLTEYNCGLFVAHCVNRWTGNRWCEHGYGVIAWKEIIPPQEIEQ